MISFSRAYQCIIVHWRIFIASLIAVFAVYQLIYPDEFGRFLDMAFLAIFVMLIASQFFWVRRVLDMVERFLPGKPLRSWLAVVAFLIYLFFFIYSYPSIESANDHVFRAADPRLSSVLIVAIFWWWLVASWAGFGLVMVFWTADLATGSAGWVYRKVRQVAAGHVATPAPGTIALDPPSPARRRFLGQSAVAISAAPFLAAGYGLLYERLDVEITHRRIRLARLPKAFEGFRIAQLSDLHISPYMTADQIRRCVAMTNGAKADLIVMTGDYISWDPEAQADVVQALAGLRAPYAVFGCLGNHEEESSTEESITRLFAAQGIRILREESVLIRVGGETINLMGIDCPRSVTDEEAEYRRDLNRRLQRLLVMPDTVNILLSHYPDVFDRAAELGIDLTLAGHTHGGQLSLEFIHRGLSLAHLLSRYDSGWYEKASSQLYVNRGIGTIGFPIRFGARPEITLLELTGT
jgi:predicted MPP superfamily phosphohydrolase